MDEGNKKKSYFLSLACYKASRKMVNQLSKRILVGHKLSNTCRYFVGKWSFTIFLAAVSFWYTVSKKYATPVLVQLIYTKGHHQKTYSRFAYPCFILCPPFAQLLPPKQNIYKAFLHQVSCIACKKPKCMKQYSYKWVFCLLIFLTTIFSGLVFA